MWARVRLLNGQWGKVAIAAYVLLAVSFLAGGASRLHELRLALVELTALPLLVLAGSRLLEASSWRAQRLPLAILFGVAAIPLLQVLPTPPAFWTALPGREQVSLALEITGVAPTWGPISLAPDFTWQAALALLPPIAIFLGVVAAGYALGRNLILASLFAGIASCLFGFAQVFAGPVLYLWPTTSDGAVVGFFANRNHLATLTLMLIPFAAVLATSPARTSHRSRMIRWVAMTYLVLAVVAMGVIQSRAGVLLLGPVMGVGLLAAWFAAGRGRAGLPLIAAIAGGIAAMAAVAFFAIVPVMDRFDPNSAPEVRFDRWPLVVEAAETYLPLGSGVGSFDAVYRSVEPLEELDSTFFNHAHNEYVEVLLETGWLGVAALAAFLYWFVRSAWTAWTTRTGRLQDMQRAATIAIAVVLTHSLVDYPIRTETIAVLFALCCALLALPRTEKHEGRARRRRA